MKKLVVSAVLAAASFFSVTAASYAETVTVTTSQRVMREHVREEYRPRHYRHAPRDCFVKKERIRRHGEIIVRKTRVCR